jgi:8-hydroxy-5-deazaflavin:NADPH oxidoreductase
VKVAMLGTGVVGKALSKGFSSRGHDVMIGSRDAGKAQALADEVGGGASGGTLEQAASFGEIAVLATRWTGTQEALEGAGPANLAGKVLIDATNPLAPREDGPPGLALGHTDSGGEQVQRWVPDARVVKAFNIVGNPYMVDPDFPEGKPDMFIAGDDADAKATVTEILESFGWPGAIDLGGIEASRVLEPMCIAWVLYGVRNGTWDHAFKLLRK